MNVVIAENSQAVSKKILKVTDDSFKNEMRKFRHEGSKEKRVVLPDVTDVLPKRSVFIRKAADKGQLISESLRRKLTTDLRQILEKPDYMVKRGKLAGTLKAQALDEFRAKITETFQGYTKRDPKFGMPRNIEAIARTEVRSTIDQMKNEYMGQLSKNNPDVEVVKTWKHNRRFSKAPRIHHAALNGKSVLYNESFVTKNEKGQEIVIPYPHHESLPPEEVISCSCEVIHTIRRKR
jgi:hypothetical protein